MVRAVEGARLLVPGLRRGRQPESADCRNQLSGPPGCPAAAALRAKHFHTPAHAGPLSTYHGAIAAAVPVSKTLEDLYSAIEWAREHEAAAVAMVAEHQAFARRHFNSRFMMAYLHYLLTQYATLLRYTPPNPEQLLAEGYQEVMFPTECDDGVVFCVAKLAYQACGCPHWPPALHLGQRHYVDGGLACQ